MHPLILQWIQSYAFVGFYKCCVEKWLVNQLIKNNERKSISYHTKLFQDAHLVLKAL